MEGSIPARAGSPQTKCRQDGADQVHPRAGGVTICAATCGTSWTGPSPRGRGHHARMPLADGDEGPSPRGRGYPVCHPSCHCSCGSIPARAGSPSGPVRAIRCGRVHPRAGGVTSGPLLPTANPEGPSPRGRGHRRSSDRPADSSRSIPARAGSPFASRLFEQSNRVHPRAGGVTHFEEQAATVMQGPSPRGRGHLCQRRR